MSDEIFGLIKKEASRQEKTLGLIPSENYASAAVREVVGSVLMNKYAEGQAGARYYQGNGVVDEVERLCKKRALAVFGLDPSEWGVNVQALSGSPANLAVYNALLSPGERIMSMFLPDGGHLSHGWELPGKKISIVSKFWEVEQYKTDPKTKLFDYNEIGRQAEKFRPKMMVSGGTAYPREIDHKVMRKIADSVGAYYLADVAHEAGLIAGGANTSPFPHAQVVTMTTHKTLRGPRGALVFSQKNVQGTNSKLRNSSDQSVAAAIDFSVFPGIQGGPHLHTIAGIAVALAEAKSKSFRDYAKQVVKNAQILAHELADGGFDVVSGGTDKHLVLVDLRSRGQSGWEVAWALEMAGIVINRNTVPQETASPFYPSGIRLGTPGVTTRGMKEPEMRVIAAWISGVADYAKKWKLPSKREERQAFLGKFMEEIAQDRKLAEVREQVEELCDRFGLD